MNHDAPRGDLDSLLSFVKKANGRVVLSGKDLSCLRRVLRLHDRLLAAGLCVCCSRLLALSVKGLPCDECACGAHQASGCAHAGKDLRQCRDCEHDFWRPKGSVAFLCDKCTAIKAAEGS